MFDDGRPCEIYGSLQATEGQGTNIELYGRDACDAETIWKHGSLTLINSKDRAMLGFTRVTMDLELKDRIRDIELVKKRCYLESATEGIEDSNEKLKIGVIQGEHSVAYLYYIAFRFAVFATVEIEIVGKGDGSGPFADVYGSLVASYSNNRQYCNTDDELKYLKTVLFDKPSNQPARIVTGTSIKLKSVMAVPAYSSVVINADLFESCGQFISGRKVLPAVIGVDCTDSIQSKIGCLHVTVEFSNPYPMIYNDRQSKGYTSDSDSDAEESSKHDQVLGFPKTYSSFNLNRGVPRNWYYSLVELFSIYVGGIDHAVHALSGRVEVFKTFLDPIDIYNMDMKDPEVLSEDKLVTIETEFAFLDEELFSMIDLKDPTQNLEVCKGNISWLRVNIHKTWGMSWYDKRICSVVRGSNGYAAVHYMIIASGVIATVEMVLYSEACVTPNIYGTLFAYYADHEYYTDYDKKFYRSRLFQRSQNMPAVLGAGSRSKVPLLKSVVAVPENTSLLIDGDLRVIFDDRAHSFVFNKLEFVIDMSSTICKELGGHGFRFEVSVKYSKR